MRRQRTIGFLAGCCALAVSTAWLAKAGDLDPPAGPIQPTMRTLDQIFEAVGSAGGAGVTVNDSTLNHNAAESRFYGGLWLEGVPGEDEIHGDPEGIRIIGLEHAVYIPSGGGDRIHDLLFLTKEINRSTPTLYRSLDLQQTIPQATLKMYQPAPGDGQPINYYTIQLQDIRVMHIGTKMLLKGDGGFAHVEQIALSYRHITWIHELSGDMHEDDLLHGP
ncbi:MAG: type VI secretion system tube protein TssD [Phycisphaerales bacterium JB038]